MRLDLQKGVLYMPIINDSKKFSILKKGIGIEGEKIIETS